MNTDNLTLLVLVGGFAFNAVILTLVVLDLLKQQKGGRK